MPIRWAPSPLYQDSGQESKVFRHNMPTCVTLRLKGQRTISGCKTRMRYTPPLHAAATICWGTCQRKTCAGVCPKYHRYTGIGGGKKNIWRCLKTPQSKYGQTARSSCVGITPFKGNTFPFSFGLNGSVTFPTKHAMYISCQTEWACPLSKTAFKHL